MLRMTTSATGARNPHPGVATHRCADDFRLGSIPRTAAVGQATRYRAMAYATTDGFRPSLIRFFP